MPSRDPTVQPDVERSLRRSMFFVPGDDARKLEKARQIDADVLLLDLEDAVPLAEKDRARERVRGFLGEGEFGGSTPAVRVNPPGTPFFEQDLEMAVRCGAAAIMLPKSESVQVLEDVAERIDSLERQAASTGRAGVRLLALVETAAGILQVASLSDAVPRIDALCFGHADFSRDMGLVEADASRGVVFHARCQLAIAARAGGLTAVDTPCLEVRDAAVIRRDALLGASLGFEGKLCIHPLQVQIANEVFTPTADQIGYAQRVIDASREAEARGRGVFTVDGKMVDAPLIATQQRVLERARQAGVLPGSAEREHGE